MVSENTMSVHVFDGNKNGRKGHQTSGVSGYIKAIDKTAKNMLKDSSHAESIKLFIKQNIEHLLFAASKKTNGILNEHDNSSREVRTAIWTIIRQYISKDSLLFVGEERPQAWPGKNWLVKWSKPQERVNKRIIAKNNATVLSSSNESHDIAPGMNYTLEEIVTGIEIAIKITKNKSTASFLMQKLQAAVNQESIKIYFTSSENLKYIDYLNKTTPKNQELRLILEKYRSGCI